ncbi:MAG TPA: hypothetical protein VGP82_24865 [Ktedonobacterales bacterium]|jgi:hypothetical protein|nr:hypothetical protein [Ktedonobacterales bacterium]
MSGNAHHQQPQEVLDNPSGVGDQSVSDSVFDRLKEELSEREPVPEVSFFEGQSMRPFDPHDSLFALVGAFGDPNGPRTNGAGNKHEHLDDSPDNGQR